MVSNSRPAIIEAFVRATRPSTWLFLALPLLVAPVAVARAEECFGGISCQNAALAAASFKLARDCSSVFQIDPSRAGEFQKAMYALRHRPMAGVWGDEFSDTARPRPIEECKRAARAVAQGKTPGIYVIVRPGAAELR